MKIERLAGTEARLYELVARLVMDPEVLRQNNNYPFKTSEHYEWFVALDGEGVVRGFMPVELKTGNSVVINNYYVEGDDASVLRALLDAVWKAFGKEKVVRAVVLVRHEQVFMREGFETTVEWTLYKKMEKRNGKEKRV